MGVGDKGVDKMGRRRSGNKPTKTLFRLISTFAVQCTDDIMRQNMHTNIHSKSDITSRQHAHIV